MAPTNASPNGPLGSGTAVTVANAEVADTKSSNSASPRTNEELSDSSGDNSSTNSPVAVGSSVNLALARNTELSPVAGNTD